MSHSVKDLPAPVVDEIGVALAWHHGDAMATIATLLADCRHLRQQLALAKGSMSSGFTRGWKPAFERKA
jgi:hypothetical protein